MNTQGFKEKRFREIVEQLEMAYAIEFAYGGNTYSIDATHEKINDNSYRTDGRGFEIWKFEGGSGNGTVIAFSKDAIGILNSPCFNGRAFIDILDQIEYD